MSDPNYFEDMWLEFENELSSYDSGYSFQDYGNEKSEMNSDSANIEPSTYETLLDARNAPEPSRERLHSSNLQERIEAIKEHYNKHPFISSASFKGKLSKVAEKFCKQGKVALGNKIADIVDQFDQDTQDNSAIITFEDFLTTFDSE